ncbi:SDR family oxidoreductase [Amnibacterium endophyticum]|uniref:SDR family oxidoreductase n=1 Tax=Amnibacterium endophyticum TaxID=2109337 RepID=A0ABW4LEI4_9MICO
MTRRAVVTGASTGIGAATVRRFRDEGWEVVAVARRRERLEALAAECGCEPFAADLTDPEQVAALAEHVRSGGPLHVLVNDAGGARGLASVEDGDPEDWRWMFEANVIATQRVTAALLPSLRDGAEDAGSGDIVTVTSIAARTPYVGGAGYNAAKAAEAALVQVLRLELAGEPLRVIEVAPGLVATEEFSLNRFGGDRARADAVYADVEHPLTAEDVAETIVRSVLLPPHVDLDLVVVKPVAQAAGSTTVKGPLRVKR